MTKRILIIILIFISRICLANMASPVHEGTRAGSAISSRDIDILSEKIHITIDKDFSSARYLVEYKIRTDTSGRQIPLLFYAMDYSEVEFTVRVDNKEVKVQPVPEKYLIGNFESYEKVLIAWNEHDKVSVSPYYLKYFETDLEKGEHIIRIEYTGHAWSDISGWVTEYSFRYSLSPAKYWKSFGSLEITLDASRSNSKIETNLGTPAEGNVENIATWRFTKIPSDFISIGFSPEISAFAGFMIWLSPAGITAAGVILLILTHLMLIRKYRKSNPSKKYSWVVITGSLLFPLSWFFLYTSSFELIDMAIGPAAGGYHGYTFLMIIFYPVVTPVYWVLMWLADRKTKTWRSGEGF